MAQPNEFIVNKKFFIGFVIFQLIITGIILYALLSPKTVTVQVERVDNSYSVDAPLSIVLPKLNY